MARSAFNCSMATGGDRVISFTIPMGRTILSFYPPLWTIWENHILHSGVAPEFPRLTVDDLVDVESGPSAPVPQPDNSELDRPFVAENLQNDYDGEIRTWQTPGLYSLPWPSSASDHV